MIASTTQPRICRIGMAGTWARVIVGIGLLALAVWVGIDWYDAILGFGVLPAVVKAALALRGRYGAPLRLVGPAGHCLACAIGIGLFIALPEPAMLFYGSSMLLVATRGVGGCEPFAIPNFLLRRDDQLACPLFGAIGARGARRRQ